MNDFNSPQKFKMRFQKNHQEYSNKKIDGKPSFKKISGKFIEPCIKIKPEILQLRVSIFHF